MIFRTPESIPELYSCFSLLQPISSLYPDFNNWYWDKVVPGIVLGNDKIIIAEKHSEIIGVSIIKNGSEKKLRALRIQEKYQSKGYGMYLIDESLKQLGTDKPVVSVAEEMINEYSRTFINRYNFDMTHVYDGLYRKGFLEYEFNGNSNLDKKTICF